MWNFITPKNSGEFHQSRVSGMKIGDLEKQRIGLQSLAIVQWFDCDCYI